MNSLNQRGYSVHFVRPLGSDAGATPAVIVQQSSAGRRIVACGAARFMLRQERGLRARERREQDNAGERKRHATTALGAEAQSAKAVLGAEAQSAKAVLGAEAQSAKAAHARLMVSTLLANDVLNRRKDAQAALQ